MNMSVVCHIQHVIGTALAITVKQLMICEV